MTYRQMLPMSRSIRLKPYKDFIDSRPYYVRKDKKYIYLEHHHICPRSLGGLDKDWNMIWLTAEDHWNAHYILWQCYKNTEYEDVAAAAFMRFQHVKSQLDKHGKKLTKEDYVNLRKAAAKHGSKILKDRVVIHKDIEIRRVYKDELDYFYSLGFKAGSGLPANTPVFGKVWMNRKNIIRAFNRDDIKRAERNGWIRGTGLHFVVLSSDKRKLKGSFNPNFQQPSLKQIKLILDTYTSGLSFRDTVKTVGIGPKVVNRVLHENKAMRPRANFGNKNGRYKRGLRCKIDIL